MVKSRQDAHAAIRYSKYPPVWARIQLLAREPWNAI